MKVCDAIRNHLKLLSTGEGCAEGEIVLPPDFPGFQGHFPGEPTLPGVCQIQIMELFMELASGTPFPLKTLSRTKFFSPVAPGDRLRLLLSWSGEMVQMEILCGDRKIAKIKGGRSISPAG